MPLALGLTCCLLLVTLGVRAETFDLSQERVAALAALPSLGAEAFDPGRLTGRVVVVGFFASWCPPCRPEFANLKRAKQTFGADLEVVAVNIHEAFGGDDGGVRLRKFLQQTAPNFFVLADGEAVAPQFGGVERIPTVFVFDRQGRQRLEFIHAQGASKTHATFEELAAAIRPLL